MAGQQNFDWQQYMGPGGLGGGFGGIGGFGGGGAGAGALPGVGMPGADEGMGPAAAPNPFSMQQQAKGGGDKEKMLMDYLTTMGSLQPEQQALQRQRAMADQLRKTPMPEMRSVSGGRIQRAANPLEFIGAAGQQAIGNYRNRQADESQKGIDAKSKDAWDAYRKRNFDRPDEGSLGGFGEGGFGFGE